MNSHGVYIDVRPFTILFSNCHQILNLVSSHYCLVEDREDFSKKHATRAARGFFPITLLVCGVSISLAIVVAVVIS